VKNAPDQEQLENFWKEIYEKKVQHNEAAYWIKKTSPSKIQAWNGAQYVEKMSKRQ
jgi:hypothetical protein